jgi:hypothetical protein
MLGLPLSISQALGRGFGLGALVSLALVACVDHRPLGQLRDGDAACQDIVAQCQDASALGEPFRSCYATGLRANGGACLSAHDDCVKSCENAPASAGAGGEGGRGEAGASSSAAGASGDLGGGGISAAGGSGGVTETGGVTATGGAAETAGATATGGGAEMDAAGHTGN